MARSIAWPCVTWVTWVTTGAADAERVLPSVVPRSREPLQGRLRQLAKVQFAEYRGPGDKNGAADNGSETRRLSSEQPWRHVDDVAENHDAEHDAGDWFSRGDGRKRGVQRRCIEGVLH
jgi:hypothetical protein